jgi:hypothetical protein
MNLITDTWRGLVRRKLWPVALLLLGALIAVPFALSKEPDVQPVPANLNAAVADEGMTATYVTSTQGDDTEEAGTAKRRRTLGAVKDPFEPAPLPKAKAKKNKKKAAKKEASATSMRSKSAVPKTESPTSGSGGGTGGGGAPSAPTTTTAPEPTATPSPTPKPAPKHSIRARFTEVTENGSSEGGEAFTVERRGVLPDEENPLVVFDRLEKGGKVAVFELTGDVTVEGDGDCKPAPDNCQFLKLRAGETEFITLTGPVTEAGEATTVQYQLDLVKINR